MRHDDENFVMKHKKDIYVELVRKTKMTIIDFRTRKIILQIGER